MRARLDRRGVGDAGSCPLWVNVFGWDFSAPGAIASDGADVWVANADSSTVVELNASTGALIHVFAGAAYGLSYPDSIVTNGVDVWILNGSDRDPGITELDASTGALVRIFGSNSPDFGNSHAMASDGTNLSGGVQPVERGVRVLHGHGNARPGAVVSDVRL